MCSHWSRHAHEVRHVSDSSRAPPRQRVVTRRCAPCSGSFGASAVRPSGAETTPQLSELHPAWTITCRFWNFLLFKALKCRGCTSEGAAGAGGRPRYFLWVCWCCWRFWRRWVPLDASTHVWVDIKLLVMTSSTSSCCCSNTEKNNFTIVLVTIIVSLEHVWLLRMIQFSWLKILISHITNI